MTVQRADVGVVTVIPREIQATFDIFEVNADDPADPLKPLDYWITELPSESTGRDLRIALTYLSASAGNVDAAVTASNMIHDWRPSLLCLTGIAAGFSGKVKIGDVVVAERIHDLCMTVRHNDLELPRMEVRSLDVAIARMLKLRPVTAVSLNNYLDRFGYSKQHALQAAKKVGLGKNEFDASLGVHDGALVSSNALLRDADYLKQIRETKDEKCRGAEMEAAGFTRACQVNNIPWLVVRGVSDFGDDRKSDHFHDIAAYAAAVTLRLLLANTVNVDALSTARIHSQPTDRVLGQIFDDLASAADASRWREVITIGTFFSRPLWLAGAYEERIALGRIIEDAAAKSDSRQIRAKALIDDIGWTSYAVGDAPTAIKYIRDGLRDASEAPQDWYLVAKANRHLASISRSAKNLTEAERYLAEAKRASVNIPSGREKNEMQAALLLSEAKFRFANGILDEAMDLATSSMSEFYAINDISRAVKVRGTIAEIMEQIGGPAKAFEEYISGYLAAHDCGRRQERDDYALAAARMALKVGDARNARSLIDKLLDVMAGVSDRRLMTRVRNLAAVQQHPSDEGIDE